MTRAPGAERVALCVAGSAAFALYVLARSRRAAGQPLPLKEESAAAAASSAREERREAEQEAEAEKEAKATAAATAMDILRDYLEEHSRNQGHMTFAQERCACSDCVPVCVPCENDEEDGPAELSPLTTRTPRLSLSVT